MLQSEALVLGASPRLARRLYSETSAGYSALPQAYPEIRSPQTHQLSEARVDPIDIALSKQRERLGSASSPHKPV